MVSKADASLIMSAIGLLLSIIVNHETITQEVLDAL